MTERIETIIELLKIKITYFSELQEGTPAYLDNQKKFYKKRALLKSSFENLNESEASYIFLVLFDNLFHPNHKTLSDRFVRLDEDDKIELLKSTLRKMSPVDYNIVYKAFSATTGYSATQSESLTLNMGRITWGSVDLPKHPLPQYKDFPSILSNWRDRFRYYIQNSDKRRGFMNWFAKAVGVTYISPPEPEKDIMVKLLKKHTGEVTMVNSKDIIHGHYAHPYYIDNYESWKKAGIAAVSGRSDPVIAYDQGTFDRAFPRMNIEYGLKNQKDGRPYIELEINIDTFKVLTSVKPTFAHINHSFPKYPQFGLPRNTIGSRLRMEDIDYFEQHEDGLIYPMKYDANGNGVISLGYSSTPNIYFRKMFYQGIIKSSNKTFEIMQIGVVGGQAVAALAGTITPHGFNQATSPRPSLPSPAQRATTPSSRRIDVSKPQPTGETISNTVHESVVAGRTQNIDAQASGISPASRSTLSHQRSATSKTNVTSGSSKLLPAYSTFEEASQVAATLPKPKSGNPPHVLAVIIFDKSGKKTGTWYEVSEGGFDMLGHTEQKAISRTKLSPGMSIEFVGHYSPCNLSGGCSSVMSETAKSANVDIRYRHVRENGTTIYEFAAGDGQVKKSDIPRKAKGQPIH